MLSTNLFNCLSVGIVYTLEVLEKTFYLKEMYYNMPEMQAQILAAVPKIFCLN